MRMRALYLRIVERPMRSDAGRMRRRDRLRPVPVRTVLRRSGPESLRQQPVRACDLQEQGRGLRRDRRRLRQGPAVWNLSERQQLRRHTQVRMRPHRQLRQQRVRRGRHRLRPEEVVRHLSAHQAVQRLGPVRVRADHELLSVRQGLRLDLGRLHPGELRHVHLPGHLRGQRACQRVRLLAQHLVPAAGKGLRQHQRRLQDGGLRLLLLSQELQLQRPLLCLGSEQLLVGKRLLLGQVHDVRPLRLRPLGIELLQLDGLLLGQLHQLLLRVIGEDYRIAERSRSKMRHLHFAPSG
jgi:hypothetical protein